ncbi:hypothetical protein Pla123a_19290 [Posidoniimonas polymericola]|uniref:LTXXQ motif protein n=1 Tax=Posidoniimonas polymericola TaxID=2528002 RepID=A0A5C5YQN8_9BACT|nr:hypothetical protein [Posidoniimonas polymericola]TWT77272.1 hypothetical protein Pla123a_19290 [Posidoniimonas polymericola]
MSGSIGRSLLAAGVAAACVVAATAAPAAADDGEVFEVVVEAEAAAAPAVQLQAVQPAPVIAFEAQPGDGPNDELDAQAKAIIAELRPQLAGKLNAHLHAIRSVANPTKEQQQAILERTSKVLDESLREYAKQMVKGNQNMAQFMNGVVFNGQGNANEPWDVVREAMAETLKETLTDEQYALYEQEQEAREAFLREATATNFVSALDKQLGLNEDQRVQIHDAILDGWQDGWQGSLRGLLHNSTYMPKLPARIVEPHLTKRQQQVWHKTQWHGQVMFGDNGFLGHGELEVPQFEPQEQVAADGPAAAVAEAEE